MFISIYQFKLNIYIQLYKTEENKKFIGRIFEDYIPKFIESSDDELSKKAVQFMG